MSTGTSFNHLRHNNNVMVGKKPVGFLILKAKQNTHLLTPTYVVGGCPAFKASFD